MPVTKTRRGVGYLISFMGVGVLTAVLKLLGSHVNSTTVALALLVVVLLVAIRWGAQPAIGASLLGMLCFNFFFLPPVGTFTVSSPDNWIAMGAFLLTAVAVGQLSARARRRAEEAEVGRREIERLYKELQDAFQRASLAEGHRQSELLKSALLDAITHDIRTPLTSIKASITTLLDDLHSREGGSSTLDKEGRREMMEIIDEETDRLNNFLSSLLELARIEAGEMRLQLRWGAVNEIIMGALERAKPLTCNHRVEVLLEDKLPNVQVDGRAVTQVIYTLVENAVKYSPDGTYVYIVAYRDDQMVRIIVEDQGSGIPPELRERVFDKFFRAMKEGDSDKTQPPGTGMGLTIARGIVEAHDGHIWIEGGRRGGGTQVIVTLPVGKEEIPSAAELPE